MKRTNAWAVGSRGRNPDNSSDRKQKSNGRWKQRLEVGEMGISNTISTAAKDFMYMGKIVHRDNPRELHPVRTEYGKAIRKDYEAHRVNEKRRNIQRYEPRSDGLVNCITTVEKDTLYISGIGMNDKMIYGRAKSHKRNRLIELRQREHIRQTYNELPEIYKYLHKGKDGEWYGVFRLSPRECLRMMNVQEDDIDKMAAVNSNTQLYKTAGNSIVVACLMAIFSQLNIQGIKPWNELTDEERFDLIHKGCFVKGEVK